MRDEKKTEEKIKSSCWEMKVVMKELSVKTNLLVHAKLAIDYNSLMLIKSNLEKIFELVNF